MKKHFLASLISSVLLLSACSNSDLPLSSSTPDESQILNPTNTNNVASNENMTGSAIVLTGDDTNPAINEVILTNSSNFATVLSVDGKTFPIGYEGISAGSWFQTSANNGQPIVVCCGSFEHMRFGLVESRGPEDDDIFFFNGEPTQTMPTTGTARYNGHFILETDQVEVGFNEDWYFKGTATFTADFANKQLQGTLVSPVDKLSDITINSTISGNGFSGSASSTQISHAPVIGKFYGENAKELGGSFNNENWTATFGAKQ